MKKILIDEVAEVANKLLEKKDIISYLDLVDSFPNVDKKILSSLLTQCVTAKLVDAQYLKTETLIYYAKHL
jgi:hypothetical protein